MGWDGPGSRTRMTKSRLLMPIRLISASAFLGMSWLVASPLDASEPRTVTVELSEDAFMPVRIKARPGDTVVFINRDAHRHRVTAPDHPPLPQEELLEPSAFFRYAVPDHLSPGEYSLSCSIHTGMTAVLEVPAVMRGR